MIKNLGKTMKVNSEANSAVFSDDFLNTARELDKLNLLSNKRINLQDRLEAWSLFMQAKKGDFKGKALWDGKAKPYWDAWNLQTGKSKEDAQFEFIVIARKIVSELEYCDYQEPTKINSRSRPDSDEKGRHQKGFRINTL